MMHRRHIKGRLYEAPSGEPLFEEKPILEMSSQKEGSCLESLGSCKSAPFCIKLLCRLSAVPLEDSLSLLDVRIKTHLQPLDSVVLYPTKSRAEGYEKAFDTSLATEMVGDFVTPILWDGEGEVIQSVGIIWEERGLVQWKERSPLELFSGVSLSIGTLGCTKELFRKPFLCWENALTIQEISLAGSPTEQQQIHILPDSAPMHIPIFPYGGYYRPGLPLDQIEPLFLQVIEKDQKTCLSITRKESWKRKGIIPPYLGKRGDFSIEFLGNFMPLQLLSMAEIILGGHVTISLKEQEEASFVYKSFFYEVAEGDKDLYWISFHI